MGNGITGQKPVGNIHAATLYFALACLTSLDITASLMKKETLRIVAPLQLAAFMAVYREELTAAHAARPDLYAFPSSHLPFVADRMQEAIRRGTYSYDSPAFHSTAKRLGIKPTRTAIEAFLTASSHSLPAKNAPRDIKERDYLQDRLPARQTIFTRQGSEVRPIAFAAGSERDSIWAQRVADNAFRCYYLWDLLFPAGTAHVSAVLPTLEEFDKAQAIAFVVNRVAQKTGGAL